MRFIIILCFSTELQFLGLYQQQVHNFLTKLSLPSTKSEGFIQHRQVHLLPLTSQQIGRGISYKALVQSKCAYHPEASSDSPRLGQTPTEFFLMPHRVVLAAALFFFLESVCRWCFLDLPLHSRFLNRFDFKFDTRLTLTARGRSKFVIRVPDYYFTAALPRSHLFQIFTLTWIAPFGMKNKKLCIFEWACASDAFPVRAWQSPLTRTFTSDERCLTHAPITNGHVQRQATLVSIHQGL